MSRTKRNYRIKTFEKLEALGISSEKEILNMKVNQLKLLIPFSVKDVLNIIEMQEYGDKFITMSTCEYSQKNGRMVVVGRKI